jgi:putative hydroxymethylpyrimidine transport system substrate-binding protein
VRTVAKQYYLKSAIYGVLWALICCIFTLSCQKSTQSHKHLRFILDRPANPNHVPLYVGHALGYFREEGIFLDIQKPSTSTPLAMLDDNNADFVCASLPRVFRAVARGHNIAIVGKLIQKPTKGFLVLQSSNIKSIHDFNGRIVGYDGAYSILPSAEVLFDNNNIQVGCRLNLEDEAINELVNKKIDIIYGALRNIEPEYLKHIGHKVRFFLASDMGMPEYDEVVIAAHASLRSDPKLVCGFQTALQRSITFCRENPQLAFEMYANLLQAKSRKTIQWEEKSWQQTLPILAETQKFSLEAVQKLADWHFENGLVGIPADVPSQFIQNI